MQKVLILGAGKIGALISGLLAESGDYEVHVADVNGTPPARSSRPTACRTCGHSVDARDPAALEAHLRDHPVDAIISSLPYYCNVKVAEMRARGCALFRPDRGRRGDTRRARAGRRLRARSCRSAASRRASSASRPTR